MMKRQDIPSEYELVQDSPVCVLRHTKNNKYHYFIEADGISANGKDSIEECVKTYNEDISGRSER